MQKTALDRDIFKNADEEERRYFAMIDRVAMDRSDQIISNGRPAHAVYLLHKFFEIAEEQIRIFTGSLPQSFDHVQIYGNQCLADAAVGFLQRANSSVQVMIAGKLDVAEGQHSRDHPFLSRIWNSDIQGRFEVALASDEIDDLLPYHFLVMDRTAMRVEMDPEDATAIASFNNSDVVESLTSLFDSYMERSRERRLNR